MIRRACMSCHGEPTGRPLYSGSLHRLKLARRRMCDLGACGGGFGLGHIPLAVSVHAAAVPAAACTTESVAPPWRVESMQRFVPRRQSRTSCARSSTRRRMPCGMR